VDTVSHVGYAELQEGLDEIRRSPRDDGRVVLVVRTPATDQREILAEGELDVVRGLVGDDWWSPDADTGRQVTVMNSRAVALVAGTPDRWALAGDQIYVDFDLSVGNLPAGSLLAVGQAVLAVSETPHTGCAKFVERFGAEAMRFVNSRQGRQLRLRGMNTRVVQPGLVRPGDVVTRRALQSSN